METLLFGTPHHPERSDIELKSPDPQRKDLLQQHPNVRMAYEPIFTLSNSVRRSVFNGIAADYLNILQPIPIPRDHNPSARKD
jgi:hypothetical protein